MWRRGVAVVWFGQYTDGYCISSFAFWFYHTSLFTHTCEPSNARSNDAFDVDSGTCFRWVLRDEVTQIHPQPMGRLALFGQKRLIRHDQAELCGRLSKVLDTVEQQKLNVFFALAWVELQETTVQAGRSFLGDSG